ncbi:MAG: M42 family metallopeptidase [Treponema sp.]|nr:M42 family metallopeptidase [Treponema sp.]
MEIKELLRELCVLNGVSGAEDEVREYIIRKAGPHAGELTVDPLGNVLVFRKGKKSISKKVMFCAHMDEVGFIIKNIGDDGFLKFTNLGNIDPRVVLGKRLRIGNRKIPGIIPIKARHLVSKEEETKVPQFDELYIDIGARSREEAEKLVSIGDVCAFESDFVEFGDNFVKAKAIDDRIGCAIMLKMLEEGPEADAWFVFSVQEEIGLRGSIGAAFSAAPDIAIVLEGTTAADLPGVAEGRRACAPRLGVVLPFMDNSAIYDRELFARLRLIAGKEGIRWQNKTLVAGGTDAGSIQRSRGGVKTAVMSAPVRSIHSPICMAHVPDFDEIYKLAQAYLRYFDHEEPGV